MHPTACGGGNLCADVTSQTSPRQDVGHRAAEDLDVAPQRPVGDVEVVDRDHLPQRDLRGAEDLPLTGHAGLEVQPPAVPALDAGVLLGYERARPNERHLAAQDVEQLRKLVE